MPVCSYQAQAVTIAGIQLKFQIINPEVQFQVLLIRHTGLAIGILPEQFVPMRAPSIQQRLAGTFPVMPGTAKHEVVGI